MSGINDVIDSLVAQWGDMDLEEERLGYLGQPVPEAFARERQGIMSYLSQCGITQNPEYMKVLERELNTYKSQRYYQQKRQEENQAKVEEAMDRELFARELTKNLPGFPNGVSAKQLPAFQKALAEGTPFNDGETEHHLNDEVHRRYQLNRAVASHKMDLLENFYHHGEYIDPDTDLNDLATRVRVREETESLRRAGAIPEDEESLRETVLRAMDASEVGEGAESRWEMDEDYRSYVEPEDTREEAEAFEDDDDDEDDEDSLRADIARAMG